MRMNTKALLLLLFAAAGGTLPAPQTQAAATTPASASAVEAIYLDGQPFRTEIQPQLMDGTVMVPMRGLFEELGAEISWNNHTKTVSAAKGKRVFTYRIGERTADINGTSISVNVPGQITGGYTLMPLRIISETFGGTVKWEAATRTVRISSPIQGEATIRYGVNLRSNPEAADSSRVLRMLPAGEKVQVIHEADAGWLEVRTSSGETGYISAKPKYSDYTSDTLAKRQGEALLTYGEKFLGTPYEFGAAVDQTGTFDCSSFVLHVFKEVLSVELPRVSYNQAKEGTPVGLNDLRPGDLLFFSARGLDIGHVAIYAGDNRILHTYSKELGVHYETLDAKWKGRFTAARRVF
ncbi:hypothetical protein GCM10010912_38380 [Paenibacillus albidus]|uniref:Copper amine oxidase n=1 Tax=Paenibacillus albidus TaxID=2041023 RepID=A0A917CLG4_9BACL|nr:stalk domain-containing protein [Paenibacillus albidus]GGF89569.1 hypothetical protein GCM10010912_38380 [Paenibacillus albidus]